ncbi:substrate-binding domain-containing protein [Pseudomonadota bacterium]
MFYKKLVPLIQKLDGVAEEFILETSNTINIAGHHTIISKHLPYIIKKHLNTFPDTKINIFNLRKSEAMEKFKQGGVDLLFYPIRENEKLPIELNRISIFPFKMVIIANKKHPIASIKEEIVSIKELKKYKFLSLNNYMFSSTYRDFIKSSNKIDINLDEGNWNIVKHMVRADVCLGTVGDFCLNREDKKHIIYKYSPKLFPTFHYALLTRKGSHVSPVLNNFIDEIKKYEFVEKV